MKFLPDWRRKGQGSGRVQSLPGLREEEWWRGGLKNKRARIEERTRKARVRVIEQKMTMTSMSCLRIAMTSGSQECWKTRKMNSLDLYKSLNHHLKLMSLKTQSKRVRQWSTATRLTSTWCWTFNLTGAGTANLDTALSSNRMAACAENGGARARAGTKGEMDGNQEREKIICEFVLSLC